MVAVDAMSGEAHEIYHQFMGTPKDEIGGCDVNVWEHIIAECTRVAKMDIVTIYWTPLSKKLYGLWGNKKMGGPSKKDLCVFNIIARHLVYLATSSGKPDAYEKAEAYKRDKWPDIFKRLMERNDPC